MTEPKYAYIATAYDPKFIGSSGGIGQDKERTILFLDPTEAIQYSFFTDFLIQEVHVFQVDLTVLEGVWPRVSPYLFNDYRLQWKAEYLGKIPASALKWINSMTLERYELLNEPLPTQKSPPTTMADGEEASVIDG